MLSPVGLHVDSFSVLNSPVGAHINGFGTCTLYSDADDDGTFFNIYKITYLWDPLIGYLYTSAF